MAGDELTIEILKGIRDEVRGVRSEQVATNQRLDAANQRLAVTVERLDLTIERLDIGNRRLDTVESTLLDLAEKQGLAVRYTRALAERDLRLGRRVDELQLRVEKLESE